MFSGASLSRSSVRRGSGGEKDVKLSKKLSWVLRHGAVDEGLDVDDAGFVSVAKLLSLKSFRGCTLQDLQRIVKENDKQRFTLVEDDDRTFRIRASQGHSGAVASRINVESLLQRLSSDDLAPDFVCVHGTDLRAWKSIATQGLSKMGRQMIHCASGLPHEHGVISGMRRSCKVLIYIDIHSAINDGIAFFRSENDVLLTPGMGESGNIPVRYFKRVLRRDTGDELFPAGEPS